jgi:DNA-binding IclR family transcriptional regulator
VTDAMKNADETGKEEGMTDRGTDADGGPARPARRDDGVRALARGIEILRLFGSRPELSQSEIAEALDLPLPTVHRLVTTLERLGFVNRDPRSRRFRLGLELLKLLGPLMEGMRAPELAREHLRALAYETGETVNLATLDGSEVVYLMGFSGERLLTAQTSVGLRLPVHCTALGKCLLAMAGDDVAARLVGPDPYPRRTMRTKVTWTQLQDDLVRARRDGYTVSDEEFEVGLVSFAVPLPTPADRSPLAINISLPSMRATPSERDALVVRLRETADVIAASLRLAA